MDANGLRWATDRLADGTWRAYAWWVNQSQWISADATGPTELAALDALRQTLCKNHRRPDGPLTNERGERILVGGGYR